MNVISQPVAQFASSPKDALQCYSDLLQTTRNMEPYVGALHSRTGFSANAPELWPYRTKVEYGDFQREISALPVIYWAADMAALVKQASESYPLAKQMYLPRMPKGFCVFQGKVLGAFIDGADRWFSAVSWSINKFVSQGDTIALSIVGYTWGGSTVAASWWADVGAKWLPKPADATYGQERDTLLKWVLSASMFMEQDILASSKVTVGGQVAKRLPPEVGREVNVVSLRRVIRHDSQESGASESPDWQSRWLVRGHWRNQWYPKAERHVPVFISPYIKGPEDKPLKPPSATVFSVTR